MAGLDVLVVDDEKNIRTTLGVCLEGLGCRVRAAAPAAGAAREWVARQPFDLAFVDLRLAEQSGLDLIPDLLAASPDLDIVVITAYATVDTAVHAIKRGARDYLPKPFTPAQIRHVVGQVGERRALLRRVQELEGQLREGVPEVGPRHRLARACERRSTPCCARRAPTSPCCCAARAARARACWRACCTAQRSAARPAVRRDQLPDAVRRSCWRASCSATPRAPSPGRSATTRAASRPPTAARCSWTRSPRCPPALQAKLLRFLQEKEFERVGENRTRRADVRVVAATNRDARGGGRGGPLPGGPALPPERRRGPRAAAARAARGRAAARAPLRRLLRGERRPAGARAVAGPAQDVLARYAWPGNVRELRNVIEHAVMLWPAATIEPHAFPERIASRAAACPGPRRRRHARRARARAHPARARPRRTRSRTPRRRSASTSRRSGASARSTASDGPHSRRPLEPDGAATRSSQGGRADRARPREWQWGEPAGTRSSRASGLTPSSASSRNGTASSGGGPRAKAPCSGYG